MGLSRYIQVVVHFDELGLIECPFPAIECLKNVSLAQSPSSVIPLLKQPPLPPHPLPYPLLLPLLSALPPHQPEREAP